jgi:hypothetical protein
VWGGREPSHGLSRTAAAAGRLVGAWARWVELLAGDGRANDGRDGRACWSRRCGGGWSFYGGAGDRDAPSARLPGVGGGGVFVWSVVSGDGVVCAGSQAGAQDVRVRARGPRLARPGTGRAEPGQARRAVQGHAWGRRRSAGCRRRRRGLCGRVPESATSLRRCAAMSRGCAPGYCRGLVRSGCRHCPVRCCRGLSMSWSVRDARPRRCATRCCRCGRSTGAPCNAMS